MKVFKYKEFGVNPKYIPSASAYKMLAQKSGISSLDFSIESLLQQYEYETFGKRFFHSKYGEYHPDSKVNGYTYGKHLYDITLATISEDILAGNFCKVEYLQDYSLPAILRKSIASLPCVEFFGWGKYK